MLKKISTTILVISLSLGFCSLHTSASQPMFFPVVRVQQAGIMSTRISLANHAPVVDFAELNRIALIRNLDGFIETPVRDLIDRFTKGYTFHVDETDDVYQWFVKWVYCDNEEILAIAQKIKAVASKVCMLRAYKSKEFTREYGNIGAEELHAKIQEIRQEVMNINSALDKIPAKKPSQEDVKAGKCKEFCFFGF